MRRETLINKPPSRKLFGKRHWNSPAADDGKRIARVAHRLAVAQLDQRLHVVLAAGVEAGVANDVMDRHRAARTVAAVDVGAVPRPRVVVGDFPRGQLAHLRLDRRDLLGRTGWDESASGRLVEILVAKILEVVRRVAPAV